MAKRVARVVGVRTSDDRQFVHEPEKLEDTLPASLPKAGGKTTFYTRKEGYRLQIESGDPVVVGGKAVYPKHSHVIISCNKPLVLDNEKDAVAIAKLKAKPECVFGGELWFDEQDEVGRKELLTRHALDALRQLQSLGPDAIREITPSLLRMGEAADFPIGDVAPSEAES